VELRVVQARRLLIKERLDPLGLARRATGGGVGRDVTDREDPELHDDLQ